MSLSTKCRQVAPEREKRDGEEEKLWGAGRHGRNEDRKTLGTKRRKETDATDHES